MREENEELLKRANDGSTEAILSLARMHIDNDNVTTEDLERGKYWLEKAVALDCKDAKKGLALLYLFPFYESRDEKKAIRLWKEYYSQRADMPLYGNEEERFNDALDEYLSEQIQGMVPGSIRDRYVDAYFGAPCKRIDIRVSLYDYLLDEMRFPKNNFGLLYAYESTGLFKKFASKLGNCLFRNNPYAVYHADITKESVRERLEQYAEPDYYKYSYGKYSKDVDSFRYSLEAILALSYFDIDEDIKSVSNAKALHYAKSLKYIFTIIDIDSVAKNSSVMNNQDDYQSAINLIKNGKSLMTKALAGDKFAMDVLYSIYLGTFAFWGGRVSADDLVSKISRIRDKIM